jgi:hypothetical protein
MHRPDDPIANSHLVPLTVGSAPARFEAWDEAIRGRAYELWSTIGNRDAGRTYLLLKAEWGEEAALPAAATIRGWAREEAWAARADADLEHSHGRTVYELQVGWLAALQLAQQTLLDGMSGAFDNLPFGGAGRLKAAETTLRVIERAGLLAVLPQRPEPEIDASASREEREAHARATLIQRRHQFRG